MLRMDLPIAMPVPAPPPLPAAASSRTTTDVVDFEAIRLLTQLGLLAAWLGSHAHAQSIFDGVLGWCPHVVQIRNSHALALQLAGRTDEAVRVLNDSVSAYPADAMVKALLAFVLRESGRPGWQMLAESVERRGGDVCAVWLARHTLGRDPAAERAPSRLAV